MKMKKNFQPEDTTSFSEIDGESKIPRWSLILNISTISFLHAHGSIYRVLLTDITYTLQNLKKVKARVAQKL